VTDPAVTHGLVEHLRSTVLCAHLELDPDYACYDSALLEPNKKLAADTCASVRGSYCKKIQVGDVLTIAHNGKAGDAIIHARDKDIDVGCANAC
jgi:hypothetical protein